MTLAIAEMAEMPHMATVKASSSAASPGDMTIGSAVLGYMLGMAIALAVVYLSTATALPIVMSPGLAALLLALTVAMCGVSAISAIAKVMRIDPAMVFNR